MADNLQPVGVRAVIEDLNEYVRGAEQMNRATSGIGKAVDDAASKSSRGASDIAKVGSAAADAGKQAEGFGTRIGQLSGKFGELFLKLAPIGAAIGGAFAVGKGIQAANDLGAAIFRLQKQTNLSAEQASELKFSFEETGVSLAQGERALIKFSRALGGVSDLEDGIAIPTGQKMAQALFDLGVRTQDAAGKQRPLTEVLGDLAETFKAMPDGIEKTSLATNLFGRSGKDLIPFLNQGREGLKALGEEANDLGLVLDQKTVNTVRANELAMKRFHAALTGISVQIGLAFLPALTLAVQAGTKLAVGFNEHVTPVIKAFGAVLGEQLQRLTFAVAPALIHFFDRLDAAVATFRRSFLIGLVSGNVTRSLDGLTGKLRLVGIVAGALGAAFRVSFSQIQQFIFFLRVAGEIVRAIFDDFTNFERILSFFPQPVQDVIRGLERIIGKVVEFGGTVVRFITGPFSRFQRDVTGATDGPLKTFRDILVRLTDFIVPALGSAITGFLAVLAIGAVAGFVTVLEGMATAFANLGAVKFVTGLIGDFIKALAAPFKFVVNAAGTALDFIGNVLGFIGDIAGKVFSFTVDVIGGAIDFLKGLTSGFIQGYMDSHPLKQPVELVQTTEKAPGAPGQPSVQAPRVEFKGVKGLLDQLKEQIVRVLNSSFFSGIGGVLVGVLIESDTSIIGLLKAPLRALGRLIGGTISETLPADIALGITGGALKFSVITTAIIDLIQLSIELSKGQVHDAAARGGFILGGTLLGAIVGGILGFFVFGVGAIPGALVGAQVGFITSSILSDIFLIFETQILNFFKALPGVFRKITVGQFAVLGRIAGILGGAIAVGLVGGLIILPGLVIRELNKLARKLVTEVIPDLTRAGFALARAIIDGIAKGLSAAAKALDFLERDLPRIVGQAIVNFARAIPGFFTNVVVPAFVAGIGLVAAVFKDPTLLLTGLKAFLRTLASFFTDTIPQAMRDLGELLKRGAQGALGLIPDVVKETGKLILDEVKAFGRNVVDGFKDVWNNANDATDGALNDAVSTVTDKFGTILDHIQNFVGRAAGVFQLLAGAVSQAFAGITSIVSSVFGGIGDIITSGLRGLARLVADALSLIEPVISHIDDIIHQDFAGPLRAAIAALRGLSNSGPPSTGGLSQNDINALTGPVQGFALGTNGPLRAAAVANVAEQGTEIAFLQRGRALLPAGTEVLSAQRSAAILGMLASLPTMAGSVVGARSTQINVPIEVYGAQFDLDDVAAKVHREVDAALGTVRSRVTRRGTPLNSEIG